MSGDRIYGITFTRWQKWRIKRMSDAGQVLRAQKYIVRICERTGR